MGDDGGNYFGVCGIRRQEGLYGWRLLFLERRKNEAYYWDFICKASEAMKQDREWLKAHKKELQEAYRLLADERSRLVFKNIIRFRVTKNRKYLRGAIEGSQYFPEEIVKPEKGEVFVDCGAFDGDTLKAYLKFNRDYKKIILFEPSAPNLGRVREYIKRRGLEHIYCFQAGVGEQHSVFCRQRQSGCLRI